MKRSIALFCAASMLAMTAAAPVADAQPRRGARAPSEAEIQAYLADKPPVTQPLFRSYMTEGERNAVLNLTRAGLASMQVGAWDAAEQAFDEALTRIESVYADNPNAERARSTFVREAVKDFKGENYERAAAYYYRGLLYLREGDYENARASFRGGQLQDKFSEQDTYDADFAMFELLSGWATQCNGDQPQAQDFYAEAQRIRQAQGEALTLPAPTDQILLVADVGLSPLKVSDGQYKENLRFRPNTADERGVVFLTAEIEQALAAAAANATAASEASGQARASAQAAVDAARAAATAATDAQTQAQANLAALESPPAPADGAAPTPAATPAQLTQARKALADATTAATNAATALASAEAALATAAADADAKAGAASSAVTLAQQLGIAPAAGAVPAVAPAPIQSGLAEDLFYQASTRGGRMVDGILAGKAQFKQSAENTARTSLQAANVAIQTSNSMLSQAQSMAAQGYNVDMSGVQAMQGVALGLAAVSMFSSMAAAAAKPQADIRYWDNLPTSIRYSFQPGGASTYKAVFTNASGQAVRSAPVEVTMAPDGKCGIGWVRSRPATEIPATAPNSVLQGRRR